MMRSSSEQRRECGRALAWIDDAAAELAIGGAGAIGPVLFESAGGQAEELGGFLGAQEAWRENGEVGSHGWGLRELREGRWRSAAGEGHDGEAGPAECRAKSGGYEIAHRLRRRHGQFWR